jgi:hypothetical protein
MAEFWLCIAISAKPIWLFGYFQALAYSIKFKPSPTHLEPAMNHQAFDVTTQHRLHDLAKAEAERLRHAAKRDFGHLLMDDFWRGANAVYQCGLQSGHSLAQRSATRLQARLARRARDRVATSSTMTTGA